MTRDDIIRLAREAGLIHYHDSEGHWTGVTNDNLIEVEENRWDDKLVRILQPFAALVAAAEREQWIAVAEQAMGALALFASDESDDGMMAIAAYEALRAAIRARGE